MSLIYKLYNILNENLSYHVIHPSKKGEKKKNVGFCGGGGGGEIEVLQKWEIPSQTYAIIMYFLNQ